MIKQKILFEAVRTRNSSTFDNSFQTLGTVLANYSFYIRIYNASDKLIDVSIDGTNSIGAVAASGGVLEFKDVGFFPKGTQFYIKGASSGTGNVYLTSGYLEGV